jgi:hypothetical protein
MRPTPRTGRWPRRRSRGRSPSGIAPAATPVTPTRCRISGRDGSSSRPTTRRRRTSTSP